LPNGHVADLEIVRHPGAAAVVAEDRLGRLCLLRQYRHAAGGWLWEVPAGKLDDDEVPEQAARRELAEEAGMAAEHWTSLGSILPSPGFCDERIFLYHATGLRTVPPAREPAEILTVHWLLPAQVRRMISGGELDDAKTLAVLLRLWLRAGAGDLGIGG
jgi:ADP-ribose pyrophosphatase